ncbi:MAG: 2-oxoacid:acceptor oxidoreductase family protein [Desulfotomaculales bacterium]
MTERIIIAGFGGQGVLFTGQLLAYAGMTEGKHVSWIPSYGAEMRGGTANCSVTVADTEISSPLVEEPDTLFAFNLPSLLKFAPRLRTGGLLLLNSSLVKGGVKRKDVRFCPVAASEIAERIGSAQLANLVMLGAYLKLTGLVSFGSIAGALEKILPPHRRHLLPANLQALKEGERLFQHLADSCSATQ